jgi:heme A synthase
VTLHGQVGLIVTLVVASSVLVALFGLRRAQMVPVARVYVRMTLAAIAVQVVIGVVLVVAGHRPPLLHWFYGAATLLALPVAMLIGSRRERQEPLWLVGGAVASLLFALRAMTTG